MKILKGNTATMPFSNSHALRIKFEDDSDERVLFQWIYSDTGTPVSTAIIEYSEESEPYFTVGPQVYFIKDFLKDDLFT